ncbi:MAG: AAA family ATPase [Parcubacteria group bacterium]|nr:AAA family ATPase [Parcubacteria group bacterium]
MNLVIIYGPPAVGKLTTAQELSKITGYKIFHGHQTQDIIFPIFGHDSPTTKKLMPEIRFRIFEEAMKQNINLIFTCCPDPSAYDFMRQIVELSIRHEGSVLFARIYCNFEDECKRVESLSRKSYSAKLHSIEALSWALQREDLTRKVEFIGEHLEINNTLISAKEVAEKIREYYNIPLKPTDIDQHYKYF